jgi:hypothetical protein
VRRYDDSCGFYNSCNDENVAILFRIWSASAQLSSSSFGVSYPLISLRIQNHLKTLFFPSDGDDDSMDLRASSFCSVSSNNLLTLSWVSHR